MRILKCLDSGCMRLRTILRENRKLRKAKGIHPETKKVEENLATIVQRKVAELLFENCSDCGRMAIIPQGAFAACKVRRNLERNSMITPIEENEKVGKENVFSERPPLEGWELTPLKYNSKLMNSIWGLYNRYSVHNFKKNNNSIEGVFGSFVAVWGAIFQSHVPAANSVAATAVAKNNS